MKKKNVIVALVTLVALLVTTMPTFAYVATNAGGVVSYDLATSFNAAMSANGKAKTMGNIIDAVPFVDEASGDEYMYVRAKEVGLVLFKRVDNEGAISYEPVRTSWGDNEGQAEYGNNWYRQDEVSVRELLKVVGDEMYIGYQHSQQYKPIITSFALDASAAENAKNYIFTTGESEWQHRLFDYAIGETAIFGLFGQYFEIIGLSDASLNRVYTLADLNAKITDGAVMDGRDSNLEIDGDYLYILNRNTTTGEQAVFCFKYESGDLVYKGVKGAGRDSYLTNDGWTRAIGSAVVNTTLYFTMDGGDANQKGGLIAVDISDPENFSNAAARTYDNGSNTDANPAWHDQIAEAQCMTTDGRYLFVETREYGTLVFDAIGGLDLNRVCRENSVKGTSVRLLGNRAYRFNSNGGTTISEWNFDVDAVGDKIGYGYRQGWKSYTLGGSTVDKSDASFDVYADSYTGPQAILQFKADSTATMNFNVNSPVACTKKLYLQAKTNAGYVSADVTVNDAAVVTDKLVGEEASASLIDFYVCDVKLNKGANTIKLDLTGICRPDNGDAAQVGGIALSVEDAGSLSDVSFGEIEYYVGGVKADTYSKDGTTETVCKSPLWGNAAGVASLSPVVIYAMYDASGMMIDVEYEDAPILEGFLDRAVSEVTITAPSNTASVKRYVWSDLEEITPLTKVK